MKETLEGKEEEKKKSAQKINQKIEQDDEKKKMQREEDAEDHHEAGRPATSSLTGRQDHRDGLDHLHHLYGAKKAYLPGSRPEADQGVMPGVSWIASSLTPGTVSGSTLHLQGVGEGGFRSFISM